MPLTLASIQEALEEYDQIKGLWRKVFWDHPIIRKVRAKWEVWHREAIHANNELHLEFSLEEQLELFECFQGQGYEGKKAAWLALTPLLYSLFAIREATEESCAHLSNEKRIVIIFNLINTLFTAQDLKERDITPTDLFHSLYRYKDHILLECVKQLSSDEHKKWFLFESAEQAQNRVRLGFSGEFDVDDKIFNTINASTREYLTERNQGMRLLYKLKQHLNRINLPLDATAASGSGVRDLDKTKLLLKKLFSMEEMGYKLSVSLLKRISNEEHPLYADFLNGVLVGIMGFEPHECENARTQLQLFVGKWQLSEEDFQLIKKAPLREKTAVLEALIFCHQVEVLPRQQVELNRLTEDRRRACLQDFYRYKAIKINSEFEISTVFKAYIDWPYSLPNLYQAIANLDVEFAFELAQICAVRKEAHSLRLIEVIRALPEKDYRLLMSMAGSLEASGDGVVRSPSWRIQSIFFAWLENRAKGQKQGLGLDTHVFRMLLYLESGFPSLEPRLNYRLLKGRSSEEIQAADEAAFAREEGFLVAEAQATLINDPELMPSASSALPAEVSAVPLPVLMLGVVEQNVGLLLQRKSGRFFQSHAQDKAQKSLSPRNGY